jgi:EAL domain-containing protein (putative c-di-GMP-specific phosphodiesterase class I)
METTAEGVEDSEQLELQRCSSAQGFSFSAAVATDAVSGNDRGAATARG